MLPRHDNRKEKLREDIRKTLEAVKDYPSFEKRMTALGYQVFRQRGIYFIDDKKVRIKGSEVGYSLSKIEKILSLKALGQAVQSRPVKPAGQQQPMPMASNKDKATPQSTEYQQAPSNTSTSLLELLTHSEQGTDYINPDLYKWPKRKRKKPRKKL